MRALDAITLGVLGMLFLLWFAALCLATGRLLRAGRARNIASHIASHITGEAAVPARPETPFRALLSTLRTPDLRPVRRSVLILSALIFATILTRTALLD